jgi:hypothetical protein
MRLTILTIAAALTLAACAPSQQEIYKADYGAYPHDYQEIIHRYNMTILKDPGSAQYEGWRGPRTGYMSVIGDTTYGYNVCVLINAKNGFGAYTGFEPAGYLIRNGQVLFYDPRICEHV